MKISAKMGLMRVVKRKKAPLWAPSSDGLRALLTSEALELEYKVLAGEAKRAHILVVPHGCSPCGMGGQSCS